MLPTLVSAAPTGSALPPGPGNQIGDPEKAHAMEGEWTGPNEDGKASCDLHGALAHLCSNRFASLQLCGSIEGKAVSRCFKVPGHAMISWIFEEHGAVSPALCSLNRPMRSDHRSAPRR